MRCAIPWGLSLWFGLASVMAAGCASDMAQTPPLDAASETVTRAADAAVDSSSGMPDAGDDANVRVQPPDAAFDAETDVHSGSAEPGDGGEQPAALVCSDSACGPVELGATANNGGANYLEAVTCAFALLRDAGLETRVQLDTGRDLGGDSPSRTTLVLLGQDRTVLTQAVHGGTQGAPLVRSTVQRCGLSPPEYFQACLDTPTLACLKPDNWLVNCVEADDVGCP